MPIHHPGISRVSASGLWDITQVKNHVDTILAGFYAEQVVKAKKIDKSYVRLWQSMQTLGLAGGKRIRPYLCILGYQAFGGTEVEMLLPIAAAQELLHQSLLIHDDIIDRDYMRYGIANIAGQYKRIYASQSAKTPEEDITHLAQSAALLAGDLLISSAYAMINDSLLAASERLKTLHILHDTIFDVAGGELLDTEAVFRKIDETDVLKTARYKTAGYSFACPLRSGATLAKADKTSLDSLQSYALHIGIAFQIADDILGVFGESKMTGKSTSSDIEEGKRTLLVQNALQLASKADATFIMQGLGHECSAATMDKIRNIIEGCGARAKTEDTAREYARLAAEKLQNLSISDIARDAILAVSDLVVYRDR